MLAFDFPHAPSHVAPMDYGAIVAKILLKRGVKQADLADRLGVTQPTISRWVSRGQEPDAAQRDVILAEAATLGILEGSEVNSTVPIVGTVGAGAHVSTNSDSETSLRRAGMPPAANNDTVAVVVRGDNMLPIAENGWLLYYENTQESPADELVGKLCVVALRDGRTLVKRLYRGREPDTWDLHAPNASPLHGQAVAWAARVTWIKPI